MGACCTATDNKSKPYDKKETKYGSSNNQITNLVLEVDSKPLPITEDDINKSINQWKEKTKRRKFKSDIPVEFATEEKNFMIKEGDCDIKNCLDEINEFEKELIKKDKEILHLHNNLFINSARAQIDYSNGEICHDFININKQNNKGFSEFSSTIHFTALNSKDLVSSKFHKIEKNILNNNTHKSQSIFNVLEELNNINNNKFENNKFLIKKEPKTKIEDGTKKIFISNNAIFKNHPPKEYSVNLNDKSKLTIRKKDSIFRINNVSITQNYNQHLIYSYLINNRTQENPEMDSDDEISKNNLAAIQSSNISNQELIQENVFYNVEKINVKELVKDPHKFNEEILELNSYINNIKYPVWKKDIHENLNFYKKNRIDMTPFYDEIDGIKIEWKIQKYTFNPRDLIYYLNDTIINIKQGIGSNSSIITGLIEICNYGILFNKEVTNSVVFPRDENRMAIQGSGFYGIKLFFNGCSRIIEIDETMPYDINTGKALFSTTDNFCINLIEKAIFKLYNGNKQNSSEVAFNLRSNPSYEIYHLTGWIPEIMTFDDVSNKVYLWDRLYTNFKEGNIMVCFGTSEFKDGQQKEGSEVYISSSTNLISVHSYSVLDVVESSDKKVMKCKNPWGHTVPFYNSRISRKSYDNFEEKRDSKEAENGIFWIEWENICNYFSYIYLNWNPEIYSYKYSFSSRFKNFKSQSKFYDEVYSLEHNTQYVITIPEHKEDFEMRVMLSRHINQLENKDISKRKSISFKLYWFEGYRIIYPVDELRILKSSNREINSDVFIFEASNQIEQYVLVILLKNDNREDDSETSFSLDFFSFIEVDIKELPKQEIQRQNKITDNWIQNKPGGNLRSFNFVNNPQYKLTVNSLTHIQIKLETMLMTPIMLCLIENGNHLSKIPYQYVINSKHPGFFFNSFSYFECVLEAGEYNIVCASQEEKHIGKYYLEINQIKNQKTNSKHDIKIEKLKLSTYNYVEYLKGKWDTKNKIRQGNLVSCDNLLKKNPGFYFNINQRTKLKFILKAITKYNSYLNDDSKLTIYLYKIQGEDNSKLIVNGANLISSAWGFFSDEVELDPCVNGYLVLCINRSKNKFSKFQLEIHSNQRLNDIKPNMNTELKKRNFKIFGKWTKTNSGGGLDNIIFCKNSQYEVTVKKTTSAFIELISQDGYLVSCIILRYDKGVEIKNICELKYEYVKNSYEEEIKNLEYEEENFYVNTIFEEKMKYLIIPFTKHENQLGNYDMTISTEEEIIVKELQPMNFKNCSILTLTKNITKLPNKFYSDLHILKKYIIYSCAYIKFDCEGCLNFHLKNAKDFEHFKIGILIYKIIENNKLEFHSSNLSFPGYNYPIHIRYELRNPIANQELLLIIVSKLDYAKIEINFDVNFSLLVDSISNRILELKQVDDEFLKKFDF